MNILNDVNTSPEQNARHFADEVFKYIFSKNIRVWVKISNKFLLCGLNGQFGLVQVMIQRMAGEKQFLKSMLTKVYMVSLGRNELNCSYASCALRDGL